MLALGRLAINYAAGCFMGRAIYCNLNKIPIDKHWTEKSVSVFISFDCDRFADSQALPALLSILESHNLKASFAIVGELVSENPYAYRKLIDAGHEVLNHGYSRHTDENSNSTLFYDNLNKDVLFQEIMSSQDAIESGLNVRPLGFRVPHFGTFQKKEKMKLLYEVLSKTDIVYSSSAMAYYSKIYHSSWEIDNLLEIPLSNRVTLPISVLDSYSLIYRRSRSSFFTEFKKMLDTSIRSKWPTAINFYVDPSHVTENKEFRDSLKYLTFHKEKLWIGCYKEILPLV